MSVGRFWDISANGLALSKQTGDVLAGRQPEMSQLVQFGIYLRFMTKLKRVVGPPRRLQTKFLEQKCCPLLICGSASFPIAITSNVLAMMVFLGGTLMVVSNPDERG